MSECEECKALRQRLAKYADDIMEEARVAHAMGNDGVWDVCVNHAGAIKGLVGDENASLDRTAASAGTVGGGVLP